MIKFNFLTTFFLCSMMIGFAQSAPLSDESKIVLPLLEVNDNKLESVAITVDRFIGNKQNGFSYPITKVAFKKDGADLFIRVTGIDNTWHGLFDDSENPYGYFVLNRRLFVVVSYGDEAVDWGSLFCKTDEGRSFSKIAISGPQMKDKPIWDYHFKGDIATLVKTEKLECLK